MAGLACKLQSPTRFAREAWLGGSFCLMLVALVLAGCSNSPVPDIPVTGALSVAPGEKTALMMRRHVLKTDAGRTLQLMEWATGQQSVDDPRTVVLFVHGSPGGWSAASKIFAEMALRKDLRLLSLDRLGWGGSAEGGVEPSLAVQAAAVATCLRWASAPGGSILVGHSLGAPVIARTAMDYPELVQGLVVVSGSVDPAMEKTTWYQAAGRWPWIRWMVPGSLRRSDAEIIGLRSELEAMLPLWAELKLLVSVVHGRRDRLVPVANVDFLEGRLDTASLEIRRVEKRGHLLPWKEPVLVAGTVLAMVDRLSGSAAP